MIEKEEKNYSCLDEDFKDTFQPGDMVSWYNLLNRKLFGIIVEIRKVTIEPEKRYAMMAEVYSNDGFIEHLLLGEIKFENRAKK